MNSYFEAIFQWLVLLIVCAFFWAIEQLELRRFIAKRTAPAVSSMANAPPHSPFPYLAVHLVFVAILTLPVLVSSAVKAMWNANDAHELPVWLQIAGLAAAYPWVAICFLYAALPLRRYRRIRELHVQYLTGRTPDSFLTSTWRWRLVTGCLAVIVAGGAIAAINYLLRPQNDANESGKRAAIAFVAVAIMLFFLSYSRLQKRLRARWLADNRVPSTFIRELSDRFPRATKAWRTKVISWLSMEQLVGTIHNPDYSEKSRSYILDEIRRRGVFLSNAKFDLLSSTFVSIASGFHKKADPYALDQSNRNRQFRFKCFRTMALPAAVLATLLIALSTYGKLASLSRQSFDLERQALDQVGPALLVAAVLLLLPIILLSYFWGNKSFSTNPRVLLLRPFGNVSMTDSLRRLVLLHVGPIGDTITLSDRGYRPSRALAFVGILITFGQLIFSPFMRPSYRIGVVSDDRTYGKLIHDVFGKSVIGRYCLISGGQAVNVATTDRWWKNVASALMTSSDVIVMDLTRVGPGSDWEIEQIELRGLADKCVFVVQGGEKDAALAQLARLLPSSSAVLHVYDTSGQLADKALFGLAVNQALMYSRGRVQEPQSAYEVANA